MKIYSIPILISFFLATLFPSCGGAEGTAVQTEGAKVVSGDAAEAPESKKGLSFKLNETIQLGDYTITVSKVKDPVPNPDEYTTPSTGKRFIAVEVIYENRTPDKQLHYNPYGWMLYDKDGYSYEPDALDAQGPVLNDGTLNPGQLVKGWVNFQIQQNGKPHKMQFQPSWGSNDNVEIVLE